MFESKKNNYAIFIQARMTSSRFPNKSLKNIEGKPLFLYIANNLKKHFKNLVILTSTDKSDLKIKEICLQNNLVFFLGDLNNVLSRFYNANLSFGYNNIIRITADCPFSDPSIIKKIIKNHFKYNNDYTSNILKPSFPQGLDVEMFKKSTLQKIHSSAKQEYEKEHVTLFLRNNQNLFKCQNIAYKKNLSHIRLCIDYKEDLLFVKKILRNLKKNKLSKNYQNIIKLIENKNIPHFDKLNKKNTFKKNLKSAKF
jgi:spore coat polysaccharide biosynthesis protein SpsF